MNQALLRFDDLAARKDDPVLFARWLFSGSLAERPHARRRARAVERHHHKQLYSHG